MSFLAGLYQLLSTAPTLVALQGARVFPVLLPEDPVLPATTYRTVGGRQTPTLQTAGVQRRRVELDFRAHTPGAADQLREATIAVLNMFHGALPNGLIILSCQLLQPIDDFDGDARQFRFGAEFYFEFIIPDA